MSQDAPAPSAARRKAGEYVVVARRYRPKSFQELVGQGQVSQALGNAIATNRIGHAYLFTGARGVGKTSTARIFAKALNCQRGASATPCGECDICQGIASGEDMDVLEIDGASNRGIDEIRQLRSNVNIRPSRARFKIYIIDEVHMLTLAAFNALLKTLEEPPEHVKFIFCTTDPEKIPITILSRCQRFDFPPVEAKSILDRLQFIVDNEGVPAEPEALQLLARRANGSMRDSQSLLEQLLSFCPGKITVRDVHTMLGTAQGGQLSALADRLIGRDPAGALRELSAALAQGVDSGQLAEQLIGYFRDMLAATVGCEADLLLHTPTAEHSQLREAGAKLGVETGLAVIQILDQAVGRMRQSMHVRTLLEMALVRIAKLDCLDDVGQVIAQLRQGSGLTLSGPSGTSNATVGSSAGGTTGAGASGVGGARPAGASISSPVAGAGRASPTTPEKKNDLASGEAPQAAEIAASAAAPLTPADAHRCWKEALDLLADMTADFARKADDVKVTGPNRLVASFRSGYTQNKDYCERPERRAKLEAALAQVAGRLIRLDFEVVSGDAPAAPRPVAATTNLQRMQERRRHPLVRQAIEMFDGEVLRVDEPRPGTDDGKG